MQLYLIRAAIILFNANNSKSICVNVTWQVSFLVLDMTGMQYVDPSGAGAVLTLAQELADCSISVYLAGHSGNNSYNPSVKEPVQGGIDIVLLIVSSAGARTCELRLLVYQCPTNHMFDFF